MGLLKKILIGATAGLSSMGRAATQAARVPSTEVSPALSEREDFAGLLEQATLRSLETGDTIKQEMEKLRDSDNGSTVWIPRYLDVPQEKLDEAHAMFAAWCEVNDARVSREMGRK